MFLFGHGKDSVRCPWHVHYKFELCTGDVEINVITVITHRN